MTTMTSPFIIKTPQPDKEERLVLVPPGCPLPVLARDATPDDLARGGYVLREDAEARLAKLDDERREGRDREHTLRARAMRAEQELEEYRSTAAAVSAELSDLRARAEKAEREWDEAKELVHGLGVQLDTLRAELARLTAPVEGEPTHEWFRATWLGHEGRGPEGVASFAREQWRAGHERARQTEPAKDRATDEELFALFDRTLGEYHANAIGNGEARPDYFAEVRADPEVSEDLALRHARAMKSVLLAAKAWAGASVGRRAKNGFSVEYVSRCRLDRAVARLAKIEKEVSRG